MRQPSFFISHGGGPCFFMDWDPPDTWTRLGDSLRALPRQLPARPRAVLVISAHWEAPAFTVTTQSRPPLLFDYYGFPEHTYRLTYPAPGDPALAQRIIERLDAAGLPAHGDATRGYDHGLFVPFKLIFPDADVPMVQLSLRAGLDPAAHLACGRALAALRDEGVLIVGSGYSYHNLRVFGPAAHDAATRFDAWLQDSLCAHAGTERETRLLHWETAPAARQAHPREEHLLPLMVAAAAAGDEPGRCVFSEPVMGVLTSAFRFGT
ncbi:class III extradiol ring-cleavage dioxygenase [Fontimonas sp. SYSU GA230001]|uniref:DODA-type extradiol aromatic ring-opening family dioxygenase n=1 Tax=Fontimonas sp. SYSU GA230001 TaxID=3142450 RepID=UPI0032B32451